MDSYEPLALLSQSRDIVLASNEAFMWMLFGMVVVGVDCPLKNVVTHNAFVRHAFLYIVVLFLFTMGDPAKTRNGVGGLFLQSFAIYLLFVLSSSCPWYVTLLVLFATAAAKLASWHYTYRIASVQEKEESSEPVVFLAKRRDVVTSSLLYFVVFVVGFYFAVTFWKNVLTEFPTNDASSWTRAISRSIGNVIKQSTGPVQQCDRTCPSTFDTSSLRR